MTNERDEPLGGEPDPDDVNSRAYGRPPEERSSENPELQAEAILKDSEERIAEGADGAESPSE
jgi:hypothetical protein